MSDYISRQAAIEAVDECTKLKITDDFYTVYTEDMKDMITDIPTADVRENIKAQKVIGGGEHDGATCWFECSRCGKTVDVNDKYCSECGARFEAWIK